VAPRAHSRTGRFAAYPGVVSREQRNTSTMIQAGGSAGRNGVNGRQRLSQAGRSEVERDTAGPRDTSHDDVGQVNGKCLLRSEIRASEQDVRICRSVALTG
jgi:hypothetical protein